SLRDAGTGVYFYIPKIQTPQEALILEGLLTRLEEMIRVPLGTIKIKVLYEEGNAGRCLPAMAWVLRRRLLVTNVGRWDYQPSDTYGRSTYNALALRAMVIDKLRERLLGLMFVPKKPVAEGQPPTLEDILGGRVKGRLYDAYRQSWVASPEPAYVAAGNAPLRAPVNQLQALLDAPTQTENTSGKPVATVASGLTEPERQLLESRGLLNAHGKITPWVISKDSVGTPAKIFTPELWDSIYGVPQGEVTIEHIQHAFYMAANYGFQILNGNFAAAIDDYELKLRFMNDLATYRIAVARP